MIWVVLFLGVLGLPFLLEWRRTRVNDALRADTENAGTFVKLSGGVTHYRLQGRADGPVIVAIHGLTTPSYVWNAVT